jgi:hypothetical protein
VEENDRTTSMGTRCFDVPHTELVVRGNQLGRLDNVASLVDQVVDGLRLRAVEGIRDSSRQIEEDDSDSVLDSGGLQLTDSPDKGDLITLEEAGYMRTGRKPS